MFSKGDVIIGTSPEMHERLFDTLAIIIDNVDPIAFSLVDKDTIIYTRVYWTKVTDQAIIDKAIAEYVKWQMMK